MAKPKRSNLKANCDRRFSILVRSRGKCEASGKDDHRCGGGLQCAHIQSRKYHSIRWDPLNALSLCAGHHIYYTHEPYEWQDFIKKHWPGRWERTYDARREVWDKDLESVLARLEAEGG